jgi:hypothetical protein
MALPAAIALFLASQGAKKAVQKVAKVYGNPRLGSTSELRKQSNLHLQRKPDVSKEWIKGNYTRVNPKLANTGSSTVRNAKIGLAGAGLVGIPAFGMVGMELYQTIKALLDEGKLRDDFNEAELEQAMMEADYDAEALDEVKGEMYSGDNEDLDFLKSYNRGNQTGLRNEQGDFMTRQEVEVLIKNMENK